MSRLEWLESRRNGIGSSDAAAVLGLSPWSSALDVYLSKVQPAKAGAMAPPLEWGLRLEPVLAATIQDRYGWVLKKPPTQTHAEIPYLLASPDRITESLELIELKTTSRPDGWGEVETAEVPEHYWVQVQHQLAVAASHNPDVRTCWVFVLIGQCDFRRYRVDLDPEYLPTVAEPLREFWGLVESRTPPEPDWDHAGTVAALNRLYVPSPGTVADLGGVGLSLADEYAAAAAEEKAAAERKEIAKAKLIAELREAETGTLPDGRRVVRKERTRAGYTVGPGTYCDFRILKAKGQK